MFTAFQLLLGSAFHNGKAEFYRSGSEKSAIALVRSEIKDRKKEFETQEDYLSTLDRCPSMLASWITEWGKLDLKSLKLIGVEDAIRVPFPGRPGWFYTMRLDMCAMDRYDNFLVFETKTSSWSIKSTLINIQHGDQVTGYWGGAEKKYKRKVTAVVPDITFLSSNTKDSSRVVNHRGDFVYREPEDIAFFFRSMSQKATEITQKMKAVYSGHDPAIFSRNGYYCNAYNRPCEFADFCRQDLSNLKKAPPGFRKRPGKFTMKEIAEPLADIIAGG
jgi:hypothetical protein